MTVWRAGDRVQDARTGAHGFVLDGRPRVQWPNGRILRVDPRELRAARCKACDGQLPPYHDSVFLAFCQRPEHWRLHGIGTVDIDIDYGVREWIDTVRP